jgi:hypothetical protein
VTKQLEFIPNGVSFLKQRLASLCGAGALMWDESFYEVLTFPIIAMIYVCLPEYLSLDCCGVL